MIKMCATYVIQISGVKSFINELNEPVGLTLGPRKLTVSSNKQLSFRGPSIVRDDFLTGEQDQLLVHTVENLEPNAAFDVKVRPVYEKVAGRQIMDTEALWEQTSCRTRMHPPVNITAPVPVAFKADTNEVIVRLLRVSENLGPIRKYYLVVSNYDRAGVLSTANYVNWHTELLRISPKGNDAETRVAAEFTQLAFESNQLEIQVGGRGELARLRRSLPGKQIHKLHQISPDMLRDEPTRQSYSEILLYDCGLKRGKWYKVSGKMMNQVTLTVVIVSSLLS
ncbi:unnamed protein product [Rodentolepis nana]|uniref:Cadherin domain-containing protein n=1 Tax=Rodentolepis nana TaxID=102285 RepID=A0A0R3T7X7_RODNA|nr:unnamed protein product [Rodentolepis nana]